MKHSWGILCVLVGFFLASQVVGLLVTRAYINVSASQQQGVIVWKSLPSVSGVPIERPEMNPNIVPVYVLAGIMLGSLLVWLLARSQKLWLWKVWFLLAIMMCLYISFFTFLDEKYALLLAVVAAVLKVFRPSLIIQNVTELFMYGGLAAIFVPMMSTKSAAVLLVLIAVYDAYAVWKSKHMIKLAQFQMKAKLFAGLLIPYKLPNLSKGSGRVLVQKKIKTAVLGGGDIAFPLLFAGVVMKAVGLWHALIISVGASIALFLLMYLGKKDKFYPAMPFIAAGCFVGYGILFIIKFLY